MPGMERRREARFKVKDCYLKCSKAGLLLFLRKPGGSPLPVLNLSAGGLEFASPQRMEFEQKLRIHLDVPAFGEVLKLAAGVRWCKAVPDREFFRVGAQFSKLGAATRKRLNQLKDDPMMRKIERVGQGLL